MKTKTNNSLKRTIGLILPFCPFTTDLKIFIHGKRNRDSMSKSKKSRAKI
jgi:hypothetical protein